MHSIFELMSLKGRNVVITGAAGHIGRVMAETIAELGGNLILLDMTGSNLTQLAARIERKWGVKVDFFYSDLEMQLNRDQLVESLNREYKNISVLINNAAFIGSSDLKGWITPFEAQTTETWRRALEVNLTAVFDLCRGLAQILSASEGATIINVASIYGSYGPDWRMYEGTGMGNPAAYAASKGGLIQLTRWMATTLSPKIRVNVISPGGVFRNQPEDFVEKYKLKTPLGRMATEDDFRGIIAYLATDLSSYVTGQNIHIDGGWGQW